MLVAGAFAQPAGGPAIDLRREGDRIVTSFSFRHLLDSGVRASFHRGLPVNLVTGVLLLRRGHDQPAGLAVHTCRIVYDIWEERFLVRAASRGVERQTSTTSEDEMLRQCTEVRAMPLVEHAAQLPPGLYSVEYVIELNPLSAEMVQRIRRWLAQPAGDSALGASGTFFGSVVGLFVDRDIGRAERTYRIRSREVRLP